MYRRELEGLLSTQNLPNHFLLFGADEYQIELFAKEILAIYSTQDANLMSLYFDEYDYDLAISHLSEPSLFGDKNVLHVKSDKKIATKELKEIILALKKNPNNKFLFEFYESDMRILTETSRAFGVNFARFFKPSSPDEAVMLLARSAAKIGLNITKNALYEIYFIHNENLYLAASELTKLATLNTHIEQDLVRRLVFGVSGISFDDFFNKFMSLKEIKNDFLMIEQEQNFSEILFINSLYKAFFRLFKLHAFIKINGRFDIKDALGYAPPPNIANTLKQQSLAINLRGYEEIFRLLNLAEIELKTDAKMDKTAFMLSLLINLRNLISTANFK
ncbi:DNA polymerase III subunit delta [Campylobacter gastrosuis]|uniref:DNA polymerase III subunit delta n=1 Tax=Campylobacter gastrosuis TaxID=2974576 RepID=A0ABT7HSM1_9BACT|nr:DNA polymerase III subunit delta [Campylobacter gastrosuis]MDL0089732.1 DNA polymerase III subunit delta [Campylobacter gastrosuis]